MLGDILGNIFGNYDATDTMLPDAIFDPPILIVSEPDGIDITIDVLNPKNYNCELFEAPDSVSNYVSLGFVTFPVTIQAGGQNPKYKARWVIGDLISKDSAYVYVLSPLPGFLYILYEGEYIGINGDKLIVQL